MSKQFDSNILAKRKGMKRPSLAEMKNAKPSWEPHTHRCKGCNTVWFHDPVDAMDVASKVAEETGDDEAGNALSRKSHDCPKCGLNEHWTDGSGKPPTYINTGDKVTPINAIPQVEETPERRRKRSRLQMECLIGSVGDMLK